MAPDPFHRGGGPLVGWGIIRQVHRSDRSVPECATHRSFWGVINMHLDRGTEPMCNVYLIYATVKFGMITFVLVAAHQTRNCSSHGLLIE